jgi:hypothetical protein
MIFKKKQLGLFRLAGKQQLRQRSLLGSLGQAKLTFFFGHPELQTANSITFKQLYTHTNPQRR